MAKGTVKWFNDKKGFGFISPEDGSDEIFVHFSDIEAEGHKTLTEGEAVQFEVSTGDKGLRARGVQRLNAEPA